MSSPTTVEKARWASRVAHTARLSLSYQGIAIDTRAMTQEGARCLAEGLRASMEGRMRLGVLLFVAAFGGNVFTASLTPDYRALPRIPARARFKLPTHEKNLGRSPTANTPKALDSNVDGAAARREAADEFPGVGI